MYISIFDIFKIGIGPSSSHTLGPMIATRNFIKELHSQNLFESSCFIKVGLYGSLALTGKGHATDKAVVLGLEGLSPENIDPDKADEIFEIVKKNKTLKLDGTKKIRFDYDKHLQFHMTESLPQHPNGMRIYALDENGIIMLQREYLSIGGGSVVLSDEYDSNNFNITADSKKVIPYPFQHCKDLMTLSKKSGLSIAEIVMENEKAFSLEDEDAINKKLDNIWDVMSACIDRGLKKTGKLPVSMIERRVPAIYKSLLEDLKSGIDDPFMMMDMVTLYAMAVNEENASGGRIVTAPTNGGAGVLPGVLKFYLQFIPGANKNGVYQFLLTAAAICMLYKLNASISGAEVGCQGEVGVACSMSAGALTAVRGGTPEQIGNAAEIAMEHHLGLTCDPIDGLVQIPCIERNGVASGKAITASNLALRGDGKHHVSLDVVIKTMYETGKDMQSKYRETSQGGLAVFARKLDAC